MVGLAPAAARPTVPETRIDRVTIYADRADVVRVAQGVGLQAGINRIVVAGLPPDIEPGSVRAAGSGSAGVRIVNVDVRRENLETPEDAPEVKRLRERQEDLESELRALRAKKEGLEAALAFLESVRLRESLEAGERLAGTGLEPERLAGVPAFLAEHVGSNRLEAAELDTKLAELQRQRDGIERELAARRSGKEASWTVEVELEAERRGNVDLSAAYSVPRAFWAPTYDVIVSDDLESIEIVYSADVQQGTGEDWSQVAITLSSAQPALGAEVPTLEPWWLTLQRPLGVMPGEIVPQLDRSALHGLRKEESASIRVFQTREESKIRAIDTRITRRAAGPFATSFEVPLRQDLPSDGRSRRLRIGSVRVEGEVEHRCVPRLSPHVFLVASVTNASEMPLLEGPSRVILGDQFLGQGRLPDVAPGQEFDLSLGVDQAVTVERRRVKRETENFGDRARLELGYRTEIRNNRREPIRLELRDQIPLSPDQDVRVRVRDLKPEPDAEPDRDGFVIWSLRIPPGGEETVEAAYEVKYPLDKVPVNADPK